MSDYDLFVGIDWATRSHEVCVIDGTGEALVREQIAHSGHGLSALAEDLLARAAEPGRIAVGIEVPRGPIVDTLLARGCHVFAINPKQLDRFRDRHTVAGAKDDRRDAYVLADALRTERRAFRRVHADAPEIIQLREMSRVHEDLVQEHTRLSHQVRELLLRMWPELLSLCPAANEPWLWRFVALAPTPTAAVRLTRSALRAFLAAQRIRRFSAEELHAVLQQPAIAMAPGTAEAIAEHLALLLPRLHLVHEQQARCERRLEQLLTELAKPEAAAEPSEHRDVTILRSLPGVGRVVAATMLAEAAGPLAARDYQTLRAQAGVAPVTRQSGLWRGVRMRRSCNRRLRDAVY